LFLDAVRKMDGRRIEGRKVIIDRELGRTGKNWLPRRLGGGKGDSRRDRKDEDLLKKIKLELDAEERAAKGASVKAETTKTEVPEDMVMDKMKDE
jgi:hypothetical protein